jgi:hypothetical protein
MDSRASARLVAYTSSDALWTGCSSTFSLPKPAAAFRKSSLRNVRHGSEPNHEKSEVFSGSINSQEDKHVLQTLKNGVYKECYGPDITNLVAEWVVHIEDVGGQIPDHPPFPPGV